MARFTDNQGRQWLVEFTIGDIRRIARRTGIDLMGLLDKPAADSAGPRLLDRLQTDLSLVIDLVFAAVEPQAVERNLSDEDFGRSLDGAAAGAAETALWEALADFFQPLRPEMAAAVQQILAMRNLTVAVLALAITLKACGVSAGERPGPADSTPSASASASLSSPPKGRGSRTPSCSPLRPATSATPGNGRSRTGRRK